MRNSDPSSLSCLVFKQWLELTGLYQRYVMKMIVQILARGTFDSGNLHNVDIHSQLNGFQEDVWIHMSVSVSQTNLQYISSAIFPE